MIARPRVVLASVGAALLIGVAVAVWERNARLEARIAASDSTAVAETLAGVIYRRDARASRAETAQQQARADSAVADATIARGALGALLARATSTRARVDTTGLPASVLEALAAGDALRLAVTPTLAKDSTAIVALSLTIRGHERTIALQDSALAADSIALKARAHEVAALTQQRAPRCGRRCGAVLGALVTLGVQRLPALVTSLLRSPGS